MLEIKAIADMMEIIVKDCRKCPLERICDEFDDESDCSHIWELFFETKVKEGGVEKLELEKILEEIEEATRQEDAPIYCGSMEVDGYVRMSVVKEIICKHLNDRDSSDDLISRQALLDDFRKTITEQSSTVDWLDMIARQKAIRVNDGKDINVPTKDGWTPVEKKPNKTGHYLVQLSRKLLNEDYSDRVVVLYDGEEQEFMTYSSLIIAWQPLPESYRPEKGAE